MSIMFNIVNVNYYIICFLGIVLCNFYDERKQKVDSKAERIFMCVSFILLTFVMMFRYTPYYADYVNYIAEYEKAAGMSLKDCFSTKAPLIFFINSKLNRYIENPQIFFILSGLFIMYVFFRWIYKYSINKYISVITFVGLLYYSISMNIVRQYLAIAIILLAYEILMKKFHTKSVKILLFITVVGIACLVHTSAVVGLSLLLLKAIPIPKSSGKVFVLYIFMYLTMGRIIEIALPLFYSSYDEGETYGTESANIMGIVIPVGIIILAWIYRLYLKEDKILVNAAMLAGIFRIYSAVGMLIIARAAEYLSVFYILLIPKLVECVLKKFNYRSRTIIAIFFIGIYYMGMVLMHKVNYVNSFKFLF